MNLTNDFLIQAQSCIERVVRSNRNKLLKLHGHIDIDIKSDHTVVTDLDKAIEAELTKALKKFDAGIGIEGEELGRQGSRETYWLIDPIDGTENFIRGLPFVRNVVTLVDNNQAVFALVYKPISDELYIAAKGEGVYRNGQPIKVSNRPLERAWIEMSMNFDNQNTLAIVNAVNKRINGFRNTGEFTYIPEGKLDGLFGYKAGGGPWDYAPRALMIEEAGGRVANIGSEGYDFSNNDFLMANPVIFDDLMGLITSNLPK